MDKDKYSKLLMEGGTATFQAPTAKEPEKMANLLSGSGLASTSSSNGDNNKTNTNNNDEKGNKADKDFKNLMNDINSMNSAGQMTSQAQIKRLLGTNFINPYEIMMLTPEATEEELRKMYKQISLLLHPDKCSDPRTSDAFHIVETAYKTLQDPEKRKIYQRILREAKERVEFERSKENKKRIKKGLPPLPEDTLEMDIKGMVRKIMDEIEDKKSHLERQELSQKKREREEAEYKKMQDDYEKQYNKEWESSRDKRVKNWTKFKDKITGGKKKSKLEIRPPMLKAEERPENLQKRDLELSRTGGYMNYDEGRKGWR